MSEKLEDGRLRICILNQDLLLVTYKLYPNLGVWQFFSLVSILCKSNEYMLVDLK